MFVIRLNRFTLLSVCVVLCLLLGVVWLCTGQGEATTVSADASVCWGLSFQEEGKTPVAPASKEELKELDAWFVGNENEKVLYLTFDLGYENGYTASILDILKEEQVPATFFVVGSFVDRHPELILRMAKEGHIIGNHTNTHPNMASISEESVFREELETLEQKVESITGEPMPKFYRPPQGVYSLQNLQAAHKMEYTTVFWSLAYEDWLNDQQPDPQKSIDLLNRRIHPGAVVLLHASSKTNCEILEQLLEGWKEMGYRFAPLSELCEGD